MAVADPLLPVTQHEQLQQQHLSPRQRHRDIYEEQMRRDRSVKAFDPDLLCQKLQIAAYEREQRAALKQYARLKDDAARRPRSRQEREQQQQQQQQHEEKKKHHRQHQHEESKKDHQQQQHEEEKRDHRQQQQHSDDAQRLQSTTTPATGSQVVARKHRPTRAVKRTKASTTFPRRQASNPKILIALKSEGLSSDQALTDAKMNLLCATAAAARRNSIHCGLGAKVRAGGGGDDDDDDDDNRPVLERTNSGGYMPGDAAKRRSFVPERCLQRSASTANPRTRDVARPRPVTARAPAAAAAVKSESKTAAPPTRAANPFRASTDDAEQGTDTLPVRPRLHHDRPDWTENSVCGGDEDARDLLQLLHVRRKHQTGEKADASGVQKEKVKSTQQQQHQQQQPFQYGRDRRKSMHQVPENLISDAVRLIKKEERDLRKQHIMSFFKRSQAT